MRRLSRVPQDRLRLGEALQPRLPGPAAQRQCLCVQRVQPQRSCPPHCRQQRDILDLVVTSSSSAIVMTLENDDDPQFTGVTLSSTRETRDLRAGLCGESGGGRAGDSWDRSVTSLPGVRSVSL